MYMCFVVTMQDYSLKASPSKVKKRSLIPSKEEYISSKQVNNKCSTCTFNVLCNSDMYMYNVDARSLVVSMYISTVVV